MNRFIPKEKLSKKEQKKLNASKRVTWEHSPVTKKIESKKLYDRKKNARWRPDSPDGCFHFWETPVVQKQNARRRTLRAFLLCRVKRNCHSFFAAASASLVSRRFLISSGTGLISPAFVRAHLVMSGPTIS